MSPVSILEIFTNPSDLMIAVSKNPDNDKGTLIISRGPGHDFKPICDHSDFAESEDEAVARTEEFLTWIMTTGLKELTDPNGVGAMFFNLRTINTNHPACLSSEWIEKIVRSLRKDKIAKTYEALV